MKSLFRSLLPIIDILLIPLLYPAAILLKIVRRLGVNRLPRCRAALIQIGIFPIRDHYYDPQFDYRKKKKPFSEDRNLPGIDWNIGGQLKLLESFSFSHELENLPKHKTSDLEFYLNNGGYESGDAEYWYQLIRSLKPKKIYEIGCGNSTLMAIKAIKMNAEQDSRYKCKHICIEPYEMHWLEQSSVFVIRKKVEDIDLSFFSDLEENDILFIDSSHIIRPQGDVLFEFLEILPTLAKGVIVHIHDIFSPKNYPKPCLEDHVMFWNEQYLLEAFLTHNQSWEIMGALNYLCHNHYDKLKSVAPFLTPDREPGSFYLKKIA